MIIFMAGYPFSGKTFVLDKIIEALDFDVSVVSPRDFIDKDEYEKLDEQRKQEMNVAAWEASLDELWTQTQRDSDGEVIVYDTCCASLKKMRSYFEGAKAKKHTIMFVFVQAPLTVCKERAGEKWLPADVIELYKTRFKENLQEFILMADHYAIIKNSTNKTPDVSKVLRVLVQHHNDRVSQSIG